MPSSQNVDPDEIAKFEQLASRWWDPAGAFQPLHAINPLRVNYIDTKLGLAGKKVADIGCGGGILSEAMAVRGAIVTGIDMGTAPLSVARLHSKETGITIDYRQTTAEALADEMPGQFDGVMCLEMLEHVPDPAAIVAACRTLLRPNGQVFFATLNRTVTAWLGAIVGAEYILQLLPKGTHEYSKFIKPHELCGWLRAAGLTVHDIIGMTYNPLTKTYRLQPGHTRINYLVHGQRLQ